MEFKSANSEFESRVASSEFCSSISITAETVMRLLRLRLALWVNAVALQIEVQRILFNHPGAPDFTCPDFTLMDKAQYRFGMKLQDRHEIFNRIEFLFHNMTYNPFYFLQL